MGLVYMGEWGGIMRSREGRIKDIDDRYPESKGNDGTRVWLCGTRYTVYDSCGGMVGASGSRGVIITRYRKELFFEALAPGRWSTVANRVLTFYGW